MSKITLPLATLDTTRLWTIRTRGSKFFIHLLDLSTLGTCYLLQVVHHLPSQDKSLCPDGGEMSTWSHQTSWICLWRILQLSKNAPAPEYPKLSNMGSYLCVKSRRDQDPTLTGTTVGESETKNLLVFTLVCFVGLLLMLVLIEERRKITGASSKNLDQQRDDFLDHTLQRKQWMFDQAYSRNQNTWYH